MSPGGWRTFKDFVPNILFFLRWRESLRGGTPINESEVNSKKYIVFHKMGEIRAFIYKPVVTANFENILRSKKKNEI